MRIFKTVLTFAFHPISWALLFLFLVLLNLIQVSQYGLVDAKQPFITYRSFHSVNVIQFSVFAIWVIYVLKKYMLDDMNTIYLTICSIFSVYGFGQLINQIFWAPIFIDFYGWFTWLSRFGYPLFFAFNNIPLYLFLKSEKRILWSNKFIFLLLLSLVFYLFTFSADMQRRSDLTATYETSTIRFLSDSLYFIARFFSILAYAFLIKKEKEK